MSPRGVVDGWWVPGPAATGAFPRGELWSGEQRPSSCGSKLLRRRIIGSEFRCLGFLDAAFLNEYTFFTLVSNGAAPTVFPWPLASR